MFDSKAANVLDGLVKLLDLRLAKGIGILLWVNAGIIENFITIPCYQRGPQLLKAFKDSHPTQFPIPLMFA